MISALSARDAGRVIEAKGMYMVTPRGRAWLVKEYPKACAERRANDDFVAAYERFEVINRDILDLFTRWQTVTVAGQAVPNGHTDADYGNKIIDQLGDIHVEYSEIEHVCAGRVDGDSTAGQRAVYELGLTGVPIVNVNNNCYTGSSSLYLARALVAGSIADCVLAVGFERMERGSLKMHFPDRVNPMDKHIDAMYELIPKEQGPFAAQLFGNAGREHMQHYGTTREQIAKIAAKNHKHSTNNPYARFQDEFSLDEVLASPLVHEPLTRLQCSLTSDGSAAAVVVSERFLDENGLGERAIEIVAQSMVTDLESTFADRSARSTSAPR